MNIHLTFQDFAKLAANGKLEKDGATISFDRPVLAEVKIDPHVKSGRVAFYLDETDDRRFTEL